MSNILRFFISNSGAWSRFVMANKNWPRAIKDVSKVGCSERFDEDTNRRIVIINLLSSVGIALPLIFGFSALTGGHIWMGSLLLAISIALFIARYILDTQRPPSEQLVPSSILIVSIFSLMVLLIVTGGSDNTGPMWIYILPPVALFFAGLEAGLKIIGLFMAIITVLLFYPDDRLLQTTYPLGYKVRFWVSLMTTIVFAAVYEYARNRSLARIQRLNENYEHLAMHDMLTGLPNRRYMQNQLVQELARVKRSGIGAGIMLCDIDGFKHFNDKFGHDCGDEVLKLVAKTLRSSIREQDTVGRWGGEEFLFILPQTDSESAYKLANIVRAKLVEVPLMYNNDELHFTASFGVNSLRADADIDEVLSSVDEALYSAKRAGKNTVVYAA